MVDASMTVHPQHAGSLAMPLSARAPAERAPSPAADQGGAPPALVTQAGPPRRSKRRMLLPLVALAAMGALGYFGIDWFDRGRFIVSTDDAYVRADMATIAAKVSGYVESVRVADNTPVKAGDLLATIDDGDYKLAVDAAQRKLDTQDATIARIGEQAKAQDAAIGQAAAALLSAQADAKRAVAEYERGLSLTKTGFATQQRMDQALADRDRSNAMVTSAAAALDGARASRAVILAQKAEAEGARGELRNALDRANRDLSFTQIRAPFDGVVGNRAAQPGQYVQPGTRLLALVPVQSAYVEANFKETQLARLKPGQPVSVSVDSLDSKPFSGTLESFAPASGSQFSLLPPENATGNFTKIVQRVPVRIRVPAEVAAQGGLRPGLSVVVGVDTRDPNQPPVSLMGALGLTRR